MAHRDTDDNSSPLDNSSSDSDSEDMEALLRMMGLCCSRQEKELTQEEYDLMLGHIAKYIQSDSCKNIITICINQDKTCLFFMSMVILKIGFSHFGSDLK